MGFSSNIYKNAADKLAQKRLAAQKQADLRREEIYSRYPRVKELEQQIAYCGADAAKTVLRGGDVVAEMTKLKEKNLAFQEELRALLIESGCGENALEPQYSCPRCGDTGYYEQNNCTIMCPCLKRELVACACEELNNVPLLKARACCLRL